METINKTKETLSESAREAGKVLNDTNTALMDMYSKQLNLSMGLYTNFLNAVMGGNKGWGRDSSYTDMFQNSDLTKTFTNLFGGSSNAGQNPFLASIARVYSQLGEYNRNLFAAFNNDIKNASPDWTEISKKYKTSVDSRLEAYKNVFKSTTDAYNKHLDSALEANKKMTDEIGNEFNSVMKQTQKLWADLLDTNKVPANQSAHDGASTHGELKKKSTLVANGSDHKSR